MTRFDHPQPRVYCFALNQRERMFQQTKGVLDALHMRPQDPDAAMARWWILTNIGEIEVERDQYSSFGLGSSKDFRVGVAPEMLAEYRVDIVASLAEQRLSVAGEVFVQLEPDSHLPNNNQAGMGTMRSRAKSAA